MRSAGRVPALLADLAILSRPRLFAFSNHRQFLLLKESSKLERGMLLTTLERGLSAENWERFARKKESAGLLMAIVGSDILLQADIQKAAQ